MATTPRKKPIVIYDGSQSWESVMLALAHKPGVSSIDAITLAAGFREVDHMTIIRSVRLYREKNPNAEVIILVFAENRWYDSVQHQMVDVLLLEQRLAQQGFKAKIIEVSPEVI
ncbi:hypothetical protein KC571_03620 [candidate division WWE3 bacterium]|uniref:Uncharacterized protein n=1 Tax=candidate division WWE3 bacterium TaxID=2053526 RepID=A0A955LHN1_UNCKA|nr:hypothetical protein [candidate division WWE3 bacterium]